MEMIEGYEIQKTILFETGYGFALGRTTETPEMFAVWSFTETAYGRDHYRKSCYENGDVAEEVFQKRAEHYRVLYGIFNSRSDQFIDITDRTIRTMGRAFAFRIIKTFINL